MSCYSKYYLVNVILEGVYFSRFWGVRWRIKRCVLEDVRKSLECEFFIAGFRFFEFRVKWGITDICEEGKLTVVNMVLLGIFYELEVGLGF